MSSLEGKMASMPSIAPYVVAKHALNGLTKAVALEYGVKGITSNAICPGLVELPRSRPGGEGVSIATGMSYTEFVQQFIEQSKTKRLTTVDEISAVAVLLASDDGGGITGAMISVDGGTSEW